jgi:hypothetical protein
MNIMRRCVAAVLLVSGAAVTTSVPASADPVTVSSGCIAKVTQVQALDLQEPPKDEVFFTFGDTRFPSGGTVDFYAFTILGAAALGHPTKFVPQGGSVKFAGTEADWPSEDDPLGSISISCTSSSPQDMIGPQSIYRVWYTVTPF